MLSSLVIVLMQLGGEVTRQALQYNRIAMESGEWFRLVSGHWVHFDWTHAGMNITGLWLLALVDTENHAVWIQGLRGLVLSAAVGILLYLGVPELTWYVGLSGVLHGFFMIVLLRLVCLRRDYLALVVLVVLIGKLVWEHYHGALTQGVLGAQVIVSAHSYGALAGVAYAGIEGLVMRFTTRRPDTESSDNRRD